MKYLKLFEAFQSNILSKTIGFINSESKKLFISNLQKVCNKIDFPESELKDEFFSYLPFKKALELSAKTGDNPCDALSVNAFPEYGVEGEKCQNGKIKRKWGARLREVECPICKGTGVKPTSPEIKLIKFWFTSDGKYVTQTAVDGVIRKGENYRKETVIDGKEWETDFTTGRISDLKNGDKVIIKLRGYWTDAHIFIIGTRVYAIQNRFDGSAPEDTDEWKKYGQYSWVLSAPSTYSDVIHVLKPKESATDEVNPYTWNVYYEIRNYGGGINANIDVKDKIKDAHFAIIMDFGKLKSSEYKNKSTTQVKREEEKEGATALLTDEWVKRQNIERYMQAIADKITSGDELTKITRSVPMIFGGKNCISYILRGTNLGTFNNLLTLLYQFMRDDAPSYRAERIVDILQESYRTNNRNNSTLNTNLELVKKALKSGQFEDTDLTDNEKNSKALNLIEKLDELSNKINEKILRKKVETIEDLEYILSIIRYFHLYTSSSDRGRIYKLSYFYERLINYGPERAFSQLYDSIDYEDEILGNIETISKLVDKY